MRYLIKFSYDGTNYSGFQTQKGLPSIQEEMERALTKINNNQLTTITASGRTDKGVHALSQYGHANLSVNITEKKLKRALNSNLPEDIHVIETTIVDDSFHARYDVVRKEYIYRINMGEYNPIKKDYVMQYNKQLDISEMQRALKYLEGTHDFKSFTKVDDEKEDYTRTIIQTNLIRDVKNVNKIIISFLGTGFIRDQVRNMIGTLIEIGEGKRKSEEIIDILSQKDRTKAGKTASPEGLYLKDVLY